MKGQFTSKLFNRRWNNQKYAYIWDDENDFTEDIYQEIKDSILGLNNAVIAITGRTGGGKSLVAHDLALFWYDEFLKAYDNKQLHPEALEGFSEVEHRRNDLIFLSFSDPEFLEGFSDMFFGRIMVRDESPRTSSIDSRVICARIKNILEEVRATQNSFILVSPSITELLKEAGDLIDFYLETAGIYRDAKRTRLLVFDSSGTPVGRMYVNVDPLCERINELLGDAYRIQKGKNISKIKRYGGLVTANLFSSDREENIIVQLAKFCYENDYLTKKRIGIVGIKEYNKFCEANDIPELMAIGSKNKEEEFVERVYDIVNNESKRAVFNKLKESVEKSYEISLPSVDELRKDSDFNDYIYDDCGRFFLHFYEKNVKRKRPSDSLVGMILALWISGTIQERIAEIVKLSLQGVSNVINNYLSGRNIYSQELRSSQALEYYFGKRLKATVHGKQGKPDLIFENKYPSEIKLFYTKSNSVMFYLTHTDRERNTLGPSYDYCVENKLDKFPLFFRSPRWLLEDGKAYDMMFPVDISGEIRIVLFRENAPDYAKNFNKFDPQTFWVKTIEELEMFAENPL